MTALLLVLIPAALAAGFALVVRAQEAHRAARLRRLAARGAHRPHPGALTPDGERTGPLKVIR